MIATLSKSSTDTTLVKDNSLLKIDYMFCSPTLRPLHYELTPTPWSDHKMQIGEVEIHPCP